MYSNCDLCVTHQHYPDGGALTIGHGAAGTKHGGLFASQPSYSLLQLPGGRIFAIDIVTSGRSQGGE